MFTSVSVIWNVTEENDDIGLLNVSLSVEGPNPGSIIYGPCPTPHTASVWPKSSSCLSRPIFDATSINPAKPIVEFIINLVKSLIDFFGLPWSNWFIDVSTSSRLLKKLDIPFLNLVGNFEYVWAIGFKIFSSSFSLNSKVFLLKSSKGSLTSFEEA